MKPLLIVTCILLFDSIYCDSLQRDRRQYPWMGGGGGDQPAAAPNPQPQQAGPWANGVPQGGDTVIGGVEPVQQGNGLGQQGAALGQGNGVQQGAGPWQGNGGQQGSDLGQATGVQQGTDLGQSNGLQQTDLGQANVVGQQPGDGQEGAPQATGAPSGGGSNSAWSSLFNWFKGFGGNGKNDGGDDYYDDDDDDDDLDYNTVNSTNNTLNTKSEGSPSTTGGGTTQNSGSWWNGGLWNTPSQTTASNIPQQNNQQNSWLNNGLWNAIGQTTPKPTTQPPWAWQNQGQQQGQNNVWPPQQLPTTQSPALGQPNVWQGPGANPSPAPGSIPGQQGNWQGPAWENPTATPSPDQGEGNWQGQAWGNPSPTGKTSTASSMSTTTVDPCSLQKVTLGEACSYVIPPPSGDEAKLTLKDVYQSIFEESIIEDLITACPPGQWCLQDSKFFNPLQSSDHDYFCNYTTCLEDASLMCNTDERIIVTSSLKTLCKQSKQNITSSCMMRVKMMLHVTMADMRRKQRSPDQDICGIQIASSDRCGDKLACTEEAKAFACLTEQCLTEEARETWTQVPHWQWYFWDPIYMRQTCQITNTTECQNILPTPKPQEYVFLVQFENMDGRVMTGLGTALVISLVGFIVAVWACVRKISSGYNRDMVSYTEVKPQYFDSV